MTTMKRYRPLLDRLPSCRCDPDTWPRVSVDALPSDKQEEFTRNRKAIRAFVGGASYAEIEAETSLTPSSVRKIFQRCVTSDGAGDIMGERGLVPYARLKVYVRSTRVERDIESGRGHCAGALQQVFDRFPEIERKLTASVLKQAGGKKIVEARISLVDLQTMFLDECRDRGLEERHEWPFNTHSLARSSISLFVQRLADEQPERFIRARHGEDAHLMSETGRGVASLLLPQTAYDVVGLDELTFDAIGTVAIDVPGGGVQDIAVERVGIVLVVEFSAKPVLSWHAYYSAAAKASDVRSAVQKALNPWVARELTVPGVAYGMPNAGYPSGLLPQLAFHPWAVLVIDNLLAHQHMGLLSDLQDTLGCLINLGPVKRWYRRAVLERAIKELLVNSAQRLPSTTGSHPNDPRKGNPVEAAVKLRIRWKHVLEIVEVALAQMNATPNEGIGMLAPIDLLRQLTSDVSQPFLLRPLPKSSQTPTCVQLEYAMARVCGSRAKGRRPYINLDRAHYTNPRLAISWDLIGTQIRIGINEEKYRSVTAANSKTGEELGDLMAQGGWGRTEHSRADRKAINRLRDRKILVFANHVDPIPLYFDHLRGLSLKQSNYGSAKPKVSAAASKLAESEERRNVVPPDPSAPPAGPISLAKSSPSSFVPPQHDSHSLRALLRARNNAERRP